MVTKKDWFFNLVVIILAMTKTKASNLALGKPTRQSTTRGGRLSSLVVDGDLSARVGGGNLCSSTENYGYSWWTVDLESTYDVNYIIVYGRLDGTWLWLTNFDIEVVAEPECFDDKWATYNRGKQSLCHYQESSTTFLNASCPSDTVGRFVRVKFRYYQYLCLCEVEVYGRQPTNQNDSLHVQNNVRHACVFEDQIYNGNSTRTVTSASKVECVMQCLYHEGCSAGVYDKITNMCTFKQKADSNEETSHSFDEDINKVSLLV